MDECFHGFGAGKLRFSGFLYVCINRKTNLNLKSTPKPGVSNSNCSVCHMRTYKVTRGPHYDVDATIAVPELNFTSCFLRKVS